MAKTALRLGNQTVTAAAPWASLPQPVLDRTVFFHHSTQTQSHPHHPHVLELLGASDEQTPALFSQYLAQRLQTRAGSAAPGWRFRASDRRWPGVPRLGCAS